MITGSSRPRTGLTPKDIVWSQDRAVMWRYRSESVSQAPPLLIVYSLVSKSYILDLVPGNSFVEHLRDDGFDVFMIDWGIPDRARLAERSRGLRRALHPCSRRPRLRADRQPGRRAGGLLLRRLLTLMAAAADPDLPLASLTTIATPVDFTDAGVLTEALKRGDLKVRRGARRGRQRPAQRAAAVLPADEADRGAGAVRRADRQAVGRRHRQRAPADDRLGHRPRPVPRPYGCPDRRDADA